MIALRRLVALVALRLAERAIDRVYTVRASLKIDRLVVWLEGRGR